MSKQRFFMTVGLPGCGKSTWAQHNLHHRLMFDEIFSSDAYREKLLGDVNDQTQNTLVFKTLHTEMIYALKEGKSVCFDATNLTRKDRHYALNLIEMNQIDCEKIFVLFAVAPELVFKQNAQRDRKVPEEVINRCIKRFEIPFLSEGFDRNITVFRKEDDLVEYRDYLIKMMGYDQKNPHHTLDLHSHCAKCYSTVTDTLDRLEQSNPELVMSALLHDIGKLKTQTWDEEKQIAHYYNHENVGAYDALFIDYSPHILDREKVAFYINYHMEPYRLVNAKPTTMQKYQKLFGDEWGNLLLLHFADENAH